MSHTKWVCLAVLLLALICSAAFALADVEINETNFPDEIFRRSEYIRIFQYKMKSFFLHKRVITKNAYGDYKVVFSEKTVITKTENERDEKSFLKAIA